jgi:hypothetical protein
MLFPLQQSLSICQRVHIDQSACLQPAQAQVAVPISWVHETLCAPLAVPLKVCCLSHGSVLNHIELTDYSDASLVTDLTSCQGKIDTRQEDRQHPPSRLDVLGCPYTPTYNDYAHQDT